MTTTLDAAIVAAVLHTADSVTRISSKMIDLEIKLDAILALLGAPKAKPKKQRTRNTEKEAFAAITPCAERG